MAATGVVAGSGALTDCISLWVLAARAPRDFFFFQAEDGIRDLTGVQTCVLPIFGAHSVVGRRLRNGLLLAASLLFYAWGEGAFVLGLCGSIAANYLFGRALDAPRRRTGVLAV